MFVGPDDMDRHLGGQPGAEAVDSDEDEARDTYMQVGIRGNKHLCCSSLIKLILPKCNIYNCMSRRLRDSASAYY